MPLLRPPGLLACHVGTAARAGSGQDLSEDLQKGSFWGLRGSNLGSGTPNLGSGPRVELQNPDPGPRI